MYTYVYMYSDPKVERIFFWRVRNLCWDYVGCWIIKKKVDRIFFEASGGD